MNSRNPMEPPAATELSDRPTPPQPDWPTAQAGATKHLTVAWPWITRPGHGLAMDQCGGANVYTRRCVRFNTSISVRHEARLVIPSFSATLGGRSGQVYLSVVVPASGRLCFASNPPVYQANHQESHLQPNQKPSQHSASTTHSHRTKSPPHTRKMPPPTPIPHVPHYRLRQPGQSIFLESASLFNFTPDENDDDESSNSDHPAYYNNNSSSSSPRHSVTSSTSSSRCNVNKPLPPLPAVTSSRENDQDGSGKARGLRKWASRLHLGGRT
ncbi:hypothetical protein QBC39DRAFT_87606 [Podospora conica]|nr:hypothetical protein QBC39DRAFT_87606 [Schizothecium conicum]